MSRRKTKRARKVAPGSVLHGRIEAERRKLQRAAAVLVSLVYASDGGLESEQAGDAASVALDLVEQAVNALDIVKLTGGES
jgi:hypothetical protein